jgi:hypothetical protein
MVLDPLVILESILQGDEWGCWHRPSLNQAEKSLIEISRADSIVTIKVKFIFVLAIFCDVHWWPVVSFLDVVH